MAQPLGSGRPPEDSYDPHQLLAALLPMLPQSVATNIAILNFLNLLNTTRDVAAACRPSSSVSRISLYDALWPVVGPSSPRRRRLRSARHTEQCMPTKSSLR